MDRQLQRKLWTPARVAALAIGGFVVVGLAYLVIARSGTTSLRVDPTRMTTAMVENGEFLEYFPFDGRVVPVNTVYLDVEEGGTVEQIFVKGGHPIEKGELILSFSNANLRRTAIDTETQLLENLDRARNTQFERAQSALLLRDALLDLEYRILELQKKYDRYQPLSKVPGGVSVEAFESVRDELTYLKDKRDLLKERVAQEDALGQKQLRQADESIERLTLSLQLLTRIVDSLDVRAPITGFLSSIDAEIGQSIARGERIGQIDQLEGYKVRVSIDQFYIARVDVGTTGKLELDGKTYAVAVQRVYPEVENDTFSVDADFVGAVPPELKRGQRLTVELSFGEPTQSLMVSKGGFFQGGGRFAYLVAEDGRSARRAPIRVGRQNPRYVEVLEGLKPGDWIVTSSYEAFNGVDELSFTAPIQLLH